MAQKDKQYGLLNVRFNLKQTASKNTGRYNLFVEEVNE